MSSGEEVILWCKDAKIPSDVAKLLMCEGFDTLAALACMDSSDIEALSTHMKRGHVAQLRSAVVKLQNSAEGGGPMSTGSAASASPVTSQVAELLGKLSLADKTAETRKGEAVLRIVDFVSPAMAAEEEVVLGGGVTIKLPNAKPKLDKVSPSAWIVANAKIMATLLARSPDSFDVAAYIRYTEMVGELGCRFTWQSVLVFDDEYRHRQASEQFAWGTEAPHLATVVLRDRVTSASTKRSGGGGGDSGSTGHRQRPTGPGGKEVCLQYNRGGSCAYGPRCKFEHACISCGKDHPAVQHTASQPSA